MCSSKTHRNTWPHLDSLSYCNLVGAIESSLLPCIKRAMFIVPYGVLKTKSRGYQKTHSRPLVQMGSLIPHTNEKRDMFCSIIDDNRSI